MGRAISVKIGSVCLLLLVMIGGSIAIYFDLRQIDWHNWEQARIQRQLFETYNVRCESSWFQDGPSFCYIFLRHIYVSCTFLGFAVGILWWMVKVSIEGEEQPQERPHQD